MNSTSLTVHEHQLADGEENPHHKDNHYKMIDLYKSHDDKLQNHKGYRIVRDIQDIFSEYESTLKAMHEMYEAIMGKRHSQAFMHFCDGCGDSISSTLRLDALFEMPRAICSLQQKYWDRVLDATGVRHYMPVSRCDEWYESISKWRKAGSRNFDISRPIDFNLDNIFSTAKLLIDEKKDYFTEMVLGVFQKLSPHHQTNKSQSFSERLIIEKCLSCNDNSRLYKNMPYLNDLRKVIGLMYGRPGAENVNSDILEFELKSRVGEMLPVDGGALHCRGHMNGNVHVHLTSEIVDDLNLILSRSMPGQLAHFKERGKRRGTSAGSKHVDLEPRVLSFNTCGQLTDMVRSKSCSLDRHKKPPYTLVTPYEMRSQCEFYRQELHDVLTAIGGIETKKDVYEFDYWPLDAMKLVTLQGAIPDLKTHQFYPTTGELQRRAMEECHLSSGMRLLEPHIGFGSLLRGLPEGVHVTGVEVNRTAAMASGQRWEVVNDNFLNVSVKAIGTFDVVLCNPPFSDSRWSSHIKHAYGFVKSEGRLVAILPGSVTEDALHSILGNCCDIDIAGEYDKAFENAGVLVKLVTIDVY